MQEIQEAKTIDEVIAQLEILIEDCVITNNRIGYFAALYHRVTVKVRDGILKNEFEDGLRMEKFDVIFANRFINAVNQWKNNQLPSDPWRIAFTASKSPKYLAIQQLLLGINAHINLDLGIAAAKVSLNADIQKIRGDFNSINYILSSLTFEVLNTVYKISPLISLFGIHSKNDTLLIQFSLENARDGAWCFAEELHSKSDMEIAACIQTRAENIEKLANSILQQSGLIRLTILIILLFEWKRPSKIIKTLYSYKKNYLRINMS